MSEDQEPVASSSLSCRRHKNIGRPIRARARNPRAGFALGPILYLLGLIGIGAGILFSGYSQILRSNIQITEDLQTKNEIDAAGATLASSATLSADMFTFCPPPGASAIRQLQSRRCGFSSAWFPSPALPGADAGRLPTTYANAGTTGAPTEVGVFAAGSGLKQLDPYGHFYIYCKWENTRANSADPALMIISAGPDGVLNTLCGDTTAKNDDSILAMTVGSAIQRSALWQTDTGNTVYYGQTGSQLKIDTAGDLTVPAGWLSPALRPSTRTSVYTGSNRAEL